MLCTIINFQNHSSKLQTSWRNGSRIRLQIGRLQVRVLLGSFDRLQDIRGFKSFIDCNLLFVLLHQAYEPTLLLDRTYPIHVYFVIYTIDNVQIYCLHYYIRVILQSTCPTHRYCRFPMYRETTGIHRRVAAPHIVVIQPHPMPSTRAAETRGPTRLPREYATPYRE